MSRLVRQVSAVLVSGWMLAAASHPALARMSGPQTFKPSQGMIHEFGAKRAVGFFLKVDGACQMTLMIADMAAAGEAHAAPSASMSFDMKPGQTMVLGSAGGETLVATCGRGGDTIEITRNTATRS